MDSSLENSNPTILNPSDLPSRHAESNIKPRVDGGTGLFDSIQPVLSYPYTEFSSSSSDDSDEDSAEEIDAQEIYGTLDNVLPAELTYQILYQPSQIPSIHCRWDLLPW